MGASKIARDISERKRVERSLKESEERYRALADALDTQVEFRTRELRARTRRLSSSRDNFDSLSSRLMQLQDEEHRRIARELHDSAGQTLAALGINLTRLAQLASHDPAEFAEVIKTSEELIQQLTQEIRTTSYLLHPPLLDERGLSALRWYVQGIAERSGLEIELNFSENFERLPRDTELVIFRVVQECLTNIHRHSGSKRAQIRIQREQENVLVSVQDDGKGISPARLVEIQSQGTGVGISGMRERVRHFGGNLTLSPTVPVQRFPLFSRTKTAPSTDQNTIPNLGVV